MKLIHLKAKLAYQRLLVIHPIFSLGPFASTFIQKLTCPEDYDSSLLNLSRKLKVLGGLRFGLLFVCHFVYLLFHQVSATINYGFFDACNL